MGPKPGGNPFVLNVAPSVKFEDSLREEYHNKGLIELAKHMERRALAILKGIKPGG